MNCQRFEGLVNDIAREQMLDVSVRREALAHSSECEHCSVRLEDEYAITLRLRNLAIGFESVSAPARVETQLLAAFGQRAPVGLPAQLRSRKAYWITAIAAMLLLVFAVSVFRARQSEPTVGTKAVSLAQAGAPTSLATPPPVPATSRGKQPPLSAPRRLTRAARQNRRLATPITNQAKPTAP